MKQKMNFAQITRTALWLGLIFCACLVSVRAQTTSFTYQGRFTDSTVAQPTSGTYQMQFALYDAGGTQIGTTVANPSVAVTNGVFTVSLDFGASSFTGADRFLEIRVFNLATSAYITLSPRQPITSTPYSIRSLQSTTADNALNVDGTPAAQIIKEGDTRLTDTRTPAAGSGDYIQNQDAAAQTTSNFNISGTGAANVFNAASEFRIRNEIVVNVNGTQNIFVGRNTGFNNSTGFQNAFVGENAGNGNTSGRQNSFVGFNAGFTNRNGFGNSFFGSNAGFANLAGNSNSFFGESAGKNTTGSDNSFFGRNAGLTNTTGIQNSFFGRDAGAANTTGVGNSFFGILAGAANTSGGGNSFFGSGTGRSNTVGVNNSFVGWGAGLQNTTGISNSFVGRGAGFENRSGSGNSFVGFEAGKANLSGNNNSFVGSDAGLRNNDGTGNSFFGAASGLTNTIGGNNTIVGYFADVGANNLNFAAAFGANSVVSTNDTIVLGKVTGTYNSVVRPADTVIVPGNLNVIGTFGNVVNVETQYNIGGSRVLSAVSGTSNNTFVGFRTGQEITSGMLNVFVGEASGISNTTGSANSFVGVEAGRENIMGSSNSVFGYRAGFRNQGGSNNSFFGTDTGEGNISGSGNTLIGAGANVTASNLNFATAVGAGAVVSDNNSVVLGRSPDTVRIPGNLTVNGTINGTITNATNAVNAQTATNATQLGGVAANQYFRSTGGIVNGNLQANGDIAVGNDFFVARNTIIGGTLTVTGAINGTATNATNAAQLGGVPAANYLTNTSNLGQSVTTANGTGSLLINEASGSYTLVPGLTQTINVPANSTLLISTDGGIQSSGAVNSFSVVDVAVFIDGVLVGARRIVISNFPLPGSVGNWALSLGQTLAAGSHTIEVKALNGFGGSANSNVSSGSDPLVRGQLTVAVIKK